MTGRAALIVFAKVPEPGTVKTRLTTLLTPGEAAELYEAFLLDSLDTYRKLPVSVRLYVDAPAEEVPPTIGHGVGLFRQRGEGLGPRMLNAFVETFVAGFERVVIIGTDHPTLPAAFIELAFQELASPLRIVLGPSDDGGYYLMGMNDLAPALFEGMTYSHGAVFEQTLERADALPAETTILPPWYDVDTPKALCRLIADLDATDVGAERTRAVVDRLRRTHPTLT